VVTESGDNVAPEFHRAAAALNFHARAKDAAISATCGNAADATTIGVAASRAAFFTSVAVCGRHCARAGWRRRRPQLTIR
jgi:hypothetical protein